jgi:hypothetical protein
MSAKKTQLAFAMYLLLGCVPVHGQMPVRDIPLHAALTPGEVLRYEVETSTSYSASVLEDTPQLCRSAPASIPWGRISRSKWAPLPRMATFRLRRSIRI